MFRQSQRCTQSSGQRAAGSTHRHRWAAASLGLWGALVLAAAADVGGKGLFCREKAFDARADAGAHECSMWGSAGTG